MSGAFPLENGLTWQEWRPNTSCMESTQNLANGGLSGQSVADKPAGTLANLVDAEHPFYCGPDSMVAPHLPVGSPERAALFDKLRETFTEDWEAARVSLSRERASAKGDLYFIRCGDAVKIGHTRNIVNRLGNMQVNSPHEVDCLLLLKGRGHEEGDWHKRFASLCIRGEWFKLTEELEATIIEERERNRTTLSFPPMLRVCSAKTRRF